MIDPRGLSLMDWADSTVPVLDPYGVTARLERPEEWREWARVITDIPAVRAQNPPDPSLFADWREWAEELNRINL